MQFFNRSCLYLASKDNGDISQKFENVPHTLMDFTSVLGYKTNKGLPVVFWALSAGKESIV